MPQILERNPNPFDATTAIKRQVTLKIEEIEETIELLNKSQEALYGRLHSITRSDNEINTKDEPEPIQCVPLAQRLHAINTNLRYLLYANNTLLERIEV